MLGSGGGVSLKTIDQADGVGLARFGVSALARWIRTHEALTLLVLLWFFGLAYTLPKFGVGAIWDSDYLNYWFGPRAVRAGINPYDVAAYREYGLSLFPKANPQQFNFTYPPH